VISRVVLPDERASARSIALAQAEGLDLDPAARQKVANVVEVLARPATTLILRGVHDSTGQFLELIALRTTADVAELRDVAFELDAWTSPTREHVVVARVGTRCADGTQLGLVAAPYPGEQVSGDGVWIDRRDTHLRVAVIDGLGHGAAAHAATAVALQALDSTRSRPLSATITALHEALRPTRGAAIGLGELDRSTRAFEWIGVGNIAGVVCDRAGVPRGLVSHNGTLGQQMTRSQPIVYEWGAGRSGVFHTDGIASSFQLTRYPGLEQHDAALLAAVLFRDQRRGHDDATVLVLREVADG